jgi:uncharacterized protein YheU (UPF0270 family)
MSSEPPESIIVPYTELKEELLLAVVESFVLREGTDYGERELTLEEKAQRLLGRLRTGDAQILYDPESQSITIVPRDGR